MRRLSSSHWVPPSLPSEPPAEAAAAESGPLVEAPPDDAPSPPAAAKDWRWLAFAAAPAALMAALAFEPRVNGRLLRSVLNPHKPVTLAHKLGLLMYILIFPVAVLCDAALECSVVAQRAWHATGLLYAPLLLGNVALRWATRTPFDARALLRCLVFLGPQRAARPAPAKSQ